MSVTKTKAAEREHLLLVMNDPEYHKDIGVGLSQDEIRKRWGIAPEDTMMSYEDSKLIRDGYYPFTGGWVKQDETSGEFTIKLKSDVRKHQMEELWGYVQRIRKMNNLDHHSKIKAPDDPELLYAIFKARVRGCTFPQIFDMYRTGTLSSYEDKPKNNFTTEFDIKKYYSKYYNPI